MYRRIVVAALLSVCVLMILNAEALGTENSTAAEEDQTVTRDTQYRKNHLGLDFGAYPDEDYFMFALTYSRRISPLWRRGIALGYSFEDNFTSLDANLYDVISLEVFQRYQPHDYFHVDFGVTTFVSASSEGGSGAKFFGLYGGVATGWKFIFVGCNVRVGLADGDLGVIIKPLARLLFAF